MRITPYTAARHLVVEPVEGASIRETLLELRTRQAADRLEIRGTGRIDGARLVGAKTTRSGGVDVIALTGIVDDAGVRLALVGSDDGTLVVGGLIDARAVELSLTIEVLSKTTASAQPSPFPPSSPPPSPSLSPSPSPSPSPSWTDVQAASAAASAPADDEPSAEPPRPGDTIEHASFGLCTVEKLEEDEDFVLVRTPQNRLLRLSLDILRPALIAESGGKRAFRSRARAGKGR